MRIKAFEVTDEMVCTETTLDKALSIVSADTFDVLRQLVTLAACNGVTIGRYYFKLCFKDKD